MKRRRFLQNLAAGAAGISCLPAALEPVAAGRERESNARSPLEKPGSKADVEGYTLLCNFAWTGENWRVYEDLRTRDGAIVFLSTQNTQRVLPKSAEAVFAEADPPYLRSPARRGRFVRRRPAPRQAPRGRRRPRSHLGEVRSSARGSKSRSTVAPATQADREATRSRFPLGKKNGST